MKDRSIIPVLESWLRRQSSLGNDCHIRQATAPKTGFSADTILLELEGCASGENGRRDLAVRVEHPGRDTFLDASIAKQARMLQGLLRHGVKVPGVIGWEDDASLIGGSFLVMDRVKGVPLPQHPSYHVAGLLQELTEEQRRASWIDAITTITSINRIEWQQEFQFLVDPAYGPAGLDNYLDWIAAWRAQACGAEAHPVIDPAILWLSRNKPSNPAVELLWGDSNAGNFLFAPDGSVIAALDFEAAAIGPAEIDLSWWFFIDDMLSAGQPSPPGIPSRADQVAIFEGALGRPVHRLDYYGVLAALRMALVIAQTIRHLAADGLLSSTNRADIANPATLMLARLIDAPEPGDLSDYMEVVRVMNQR